LRSSRALLLRWSPLLLCVLLTACGKPRFKPVYPVKGRVLVNGKPAAGVTVRFISLDDPDDELARPLGTTDDDGWFTVSTYKLDDGLPAGAYAVSLSWLPKGYHGPPENANKLPAHYKDPETSGIKVQIKAGDNVLEPFVLEK
jgi:hypothetical protein